LFWPENRKNNSRFTKEKEYNMTKTSQNMKKIVLTLICAVALAACTDGQKQQERRAEVIRDSLMQVINQKDAELNDIMGTFNDIQEGFREINMAQGRVNLNAPGSEKMAKADIMENITFIQRTMQLNRERIARLQQQLKTSSINADKLKSTIDELSRQMEEKEKQIQELEAKLKAKDIQIEEQTKTIENLNTNVAELTASNELKTQSVNRQDRELHTAWYVFGTKKELKEQGIVKSSQVLRNSDFNKDYFTKIDIRVVKSIKLYSKSATLLTSHPADSYVLERDAQKQYTLYIKKPDVFWSISKYLVIQVK